MKSSMIIRCFLVLAFVMGLATYLSQLPAKQINNKTNQSKAAIVAEMRNLIDKIEQVEEESGVKDKSGTVIYGPKESKKLWNLSQAVKSRLDYLNYGNGTQRVNAAEDNLVSESRNYPYTINQVKQGLGEIKGRIPAKLLIHYKVFLVPYAVSGVSGIGGPGFSMVYALPESFRATEKDLKVTLFHELGHHIQLTYMPIETKEGAEFWEEYLDFRGGSWHDAGEANTSAWSSSSEEIFAEDFRMIYGKNQPYFGDMILGDPRSKPQVVQLFKELITDLSKVTDKVKYQSPWVPENNWFWLHQGEFIICLWIAFFGAGGLYLHQSSSKPMFIFQSASIQSFKE